LTYAGCDLGTISAKAVIIENGNILAAEILPYKSLPKKAAIDVMEKAINKAVLTKGDIACCTSTGFGKKAVSAADHDVPDLMCLSRAFNKLNRDVRTVIDAGGYTIRAFNISKTGKVTSSTANEKCAAGTGKFMEVMANALEMSVDELSVAALESNNPLSITSQCGVFAESEVITHVNEGKDRRDIFAGISLSAAGKIAAVVRRIGLDQPFAIVGGLAKNRIVVRDIEMELGVSFVKYNMDPQAVAAYGAALIAEERSGG
jgi:(R)-2-hydroxyacyl-CoA dehydratese activating ATPase